MSIDKQIEMENRKNSPSEDSHDKILEMMEESLKLNKKIYKIVKKLKSQMFWQSVFGFIRVLIIVVPLVLGFYYLSPYMKQAYQQYQQILGMTEQAGNINLNLDALPKDILNKFK